MDMEPGQDGITLFLCGDVMLGRGIDQIMHCPGDPTLYESYVTSALGYVELAEKAHGPIPRDCPFDYVWGDALGDLDAAGPAARIINLETSITTSLKPVPKGINYKMHPGNVPCVKQAKVDCCVLANNHVLDWGQAGLLETLSVLRREGLAAAGAGTDLAEAERPVEIALAGGVRLLVFGLGSTTSGIPRDWAARQDRPGVWLLPDLSPAAASRTAERILGMRKPGDLVVVSIHWGSNWGYEVPQEQPSFAHALIDAGACDLIHGHSSHHPRPLEVYKGRLVLYGCGDFITDYEGIYGYEQYRGDLALAYLARYSCEGALTELMLVPYQMHRFRLRRASKKDTDWLQSTLDRESAPFGTHIARKDSHLAVAWQ
jgi:poly-gamma-glutamate capsule biosynthesis protein CapA/YwtB (metallophosphatase superfamily)